MEAFERMVCEYGIDSEGKYPGFCSDPFCTSDFSRPVLAKFLPRLAAAIAIFLVGLYVNSLSQAWLQKNISGYYEKGWLPVAPRNSTVVLWDVTFYALPYVTSTTPADIFANTAPASVFLRFVVVPGPMSMRWTILCRWLVIWGMLWFLRALTIITTPLPNPDPTCKPKISHPDNIALEAFMIPLGDLTCQDVLYSGHTVALTLSMLFIFRYVTRSPWFPSSASHKWCSTSTAVYMIGGAVLLAGYYFIAASHFHYTVDVLIGCMATCLMFALYHYAIRVYTVRRRRSRLFVYYFLSWFETHAKDLRLWRQNTKLALLELQHEDTI